jgi:hypothetical protein
MSSQVSNNDKEFRKDDLIYTYTKVKSNMTIKYFAYKDKYTSVNHILKVGSNLNHKLPWKK